MKKILQLDNYRKKVFDDIKHIDEEGYEYWYARELQLALEYKEWRKFNGVIGKSIIACINSNINALDHFVDVDKMVDIGSKTKRKQNDYKLSRYACYLIVQNADPRKEKVSLGQSYFAVQTRKMELTEEEYGNLSEDEKRLYRRQITKDQNKILYGIAKSKGVIDFDKFTNAGYRGLYNGETANDIAKRKGLRYREEILDNMSSAELGANIFRITETEELLQKQNNKSEKEANNTHYRVGKAVRKTIKTLGGTLPENMNTPNKSLKEIENNQVFEK